MRMFNAPMPEYTALPVPRDAHGQLELPDDPELLVNDWVQRL